MFNYLTVFKLFIQCLKRKEKIKYLYLFVVCYFAFLITKYIKSPIIGRTNAINAQAGAFILGLLFASLYTKYAHTLPITSQKIIGIKIHMNEYTIAVP